jgi:DNA-directed RNA polymerase specialized sigma24 family protein
MRYRLDAPRQQIAQELGLAESGVKALLERLRERLKECVERKMSRDDR